MNHFFQSGVPDRGDIADGKRVLLIGGGGTLGGYTAKSLLARGAWVDVICLEEATSQDEHLRYFRANADEDFLRDLLHVRRYDGIVNFIHYADPAVYRRIHPLLIAATDHLIFLSSYRVYADAVHPITESAPRLHEVYKDDPVLMKTDDYGISKCMSEDYLFGECVGEPWTVVRPVISFSHRRMDLLLYSGHAVLDYAAEGRELLLPESVRAYHAGLDWAGNSGRLIAHLLFKKEALGRAFTVYSGHGMTWGEVAELYTELIGLRVRWCSDEEYTATRPMPPEKDIMWLYDRRFDREIDNRAILAATGLKKTELAPLRTGILQELSTLKGEEK